MRNINDVINSVDEVINNARKNANIEEMLNKTKAYAKKSAEAIEISRKKIELLDAKTKLSKAYEKYGKLQFEIFDGSEVDESKLNACTDEIIMLKSQAEFLEEEIDAFKAAVAAEVDAVMNNSKKSDDVVVEDVEVVESDS